MKLLYSVICEHARSRPDGRVDLEGVFHELRASGFPARQDDLTLVAVVEWGPRERGTIGFTVDCLDPAGRRYLRDEQGEFVKIAEGSTEVADFGPEHGPPFTPFILPMRNLPFLKSGAHQFVLTIGKTPIKLARLHLIHVPEKDAETVAGGGSGSGSGFGE